ncbi:MAG: T9SS type A sorting domain-containing protein, partial [Cytophagaceae bacterium]|nr:T9SS type A sorting domain-containing protein [Cytophagaceae bacterium]
APTASNTTWVTTTVQINLAAGTNTIKFVSTSAQGSPYMDELIYGSGTVSAATCTAAKMSAVSPGSTLQFSIAPNPSTETFTLVVEESVESFAIVNDQGIVVHTGKSMTEGESIIIGERLAAGLYIVIIQYSNGRTESRRIQKLE